MEIIGIGNRIVDRWKAFTKKATGQSRTRLPDRVHTTNRGTETVQMTAGMRNMLPANQQPRKRGQPSTRGQQNGQQARGQTTAQRPVRCGTCGGWYGALKGGRPRAHRDLSRQNLPCPGGGALKTPRKK